MKQNYNNIPVDILFAGSDIGDLKISPDGKYLAFLLRKAKKTDLMLYDLINKQYEQLTWLPEITGKGIAYGGSFDWSPDSNFIVYTDRKGQLNIISVEGGLPLQITSNNHSFIASKISPDGSKVICIGENSKSANIVYAYTNGNQWVQRVKVNFDFIQDPIWSVDGEKIAWMAYNNPFMPWENSKIYIGNLNGEYKVIPSLKEISTPYAVCQPKWSPKGNYFTYFADISGYMNLYLSNKEGDNAINIINKDNDCVYPSWGSGNCNYVWDRDENYIIYTLIEDAKINLFKYEIKTNENERITDNGGVYSSLNISNNKIYSIYESSVKKRQIVSIDIKSKNNKCIYKSSVKGFELFNLSNAKYIKWKNKDNIEINGLLYQAKNSKYKIPPLLIFAHGGPTGLYMDKWYIKTQFFANNGWNVLAVNYRGSGGNGKAYQKLLNGNWGIYDVEDCKSGAENLIELGEAEKDKIAITGTSAGGYTTLMSLITYPDFYKAGISFYGVIDLYELIEKTHRLEKYYNNSLIGKLPDSKEKYKSRSPIFLADKIKKPVLLLQGDNDKVVTKSQFENFILELKNHNKKFYYKLYDNEGHGFSVHSEKDALYKSLKFLNKFVINW